MSDISWSPVRKTRDKVVPLSKTSGSSSHPACCVQGDGSPPWFGEYSIVNTDGNYSPTDQGLLPPRPSARRSACIVPSNPPNSMRQVLFIIGPAMASEMLIIFSRTGQDLYSSPRSSCSATANPSVLGGELCVVSKEAWLMVIRINAFNNPSVLNVVSDNSALIA